MQTARVRVKFGSLEVEYEGDQSFVNEGLLGLVGDVVALSRRLPGATDPANGRQQSDSQMHFESAGGDLTISTIAAHLQPDGPQELIMCALAKLQIVDGKPKVERSEITAEAKNATSYFKASMAKNFPRDLGRMIRAKKINEVSNGVYSLTAASRQDLESKIAGIG